MNGANEKCLGEKIFGRGNIKESAQNNADLYFWLCSIFLKMNGIIPKSFKTNNVTWFRLLGCTLFRPSFWTGQRGLRRGGFFFL